MCGSDFVVVSFIMLPGACYISIFILELRWINYLFGFFGRGLLLFLLLVHGLQQQVLEILVLDTLVGGDVFLSERKTGHFFSTASHHQHGAFELRDELTLLLAKHGIRIEKAMQQRFLDAEFGCDLVFEIAEAEGHRGVALGHIRNELARLVRLELVVELEIALEDGGALLGLAGLAFAG